MVIRSEKSTDVSDIRTVTKAAFLHAPHADGNEGHIVDALRDANALAISLVAELQGKIIGHVALSPVNISDGSKDWFGLGPISVLPDLQNQGVGRSLMGKAIEQLRKINANGCVLLGDPNYYSRFGFCATDKLILADVPPEYFQTLSLRPNQAQGFVTYHTAFSIGE